MLLRKFNPKGINAFSIFLDDLRFGELTDLPDGFLKNNNTTQVVKPEIQLDDEPHFSSKYEMAESLHIKLVLGDEIKNIWSDVGLWTWISAYLFNIVCPEQNEVRKPGENYRHILESSRIGGGWSRFYRHLVASPVRLYDFSGDCSKILLASPIHSGGDFIEQFASRRDIVSNLTVIAVLNRLYYNENTGKAKKGAQSKIKPGHHLRYLFFLDQLFLNYDVHSMSEDQLIDLLPSEFDSWVN